MTTEILKTKIDEILKNMYGVNEDGGICHFFNAGPEYKIVSSIDEAIEYLNMKDGADLVQFCNGNYGFVAYYNGKEDAFEIIG